MAQQQKSSRLQKLLGLIDGEQVLERRAVAAGARDTSSAHSPPPLRPVASAGGSSLAIRKQAAAQIAGIAAAHPSQLPAVVAAVAAHLRHRDWDARVAAGHCLGLLAEHFSHHTAADLAAAAAVGGAVDEQHAAVKQEPAAVAEGAASEVKSEAGSQPHLLSFACFDVQQVLSQGTPMLASGGEVRAVGLMLTPVLVCPTPRETACCHGTFDDAVRSCTSPCPKLVSTSLPPQEYELPASEAGLSRAEQLRRQRGALKQRLGLGGPMDGLMDTEALFKDEDLLEDSKSEASGGSSRRAGASTAASKQRAPGGKAAAAPPPPQHKDASQLLADMGGLSARERAAAVRRAKSLKRSASGVGGAGPSPPKKARGGSAQAGASTPAASDAPDTAEAAAAAAEAAEQEWQDVLQGGRWPFQSLCDQLCVDVLHPRWKVRHGAALALREVLAAQAGAAGVHAPLAAQPGGWAAGGAGKLALGPVSAADAAAAASANAGWLEDCAIHLLCVLALDRFGDFVSDQVGRWCRVGTRAQCCNLILPQCQRRQRHASGCMQTWKLTAGMLPHSQVVAPVRETAAQALGAAVRPLPPAALPALLGALRQLSECPAEWEVRHGGLLGLKYVLAARTAGGGGVGAALLDAVLPAAVVGLQVGRAWGRWVCGSWLGSRIRAPERMCACWCRTARVVLCPPTMPLSLHPPFLPLRIRTTMCRRWLPRRCCRPPRSSLPAAAVRLPQRRCGSCCGTRCWSWRIFPQPPPA